jgi:hypothetical protein
LIPWQARAELAWACQLDDFSWAGVNFTRRGMEKICWNIMASIGLIVCSQTASAALDGRVATVAGNSAYRNLSQLDDPKSNAGSVAGFVRDFSLILNNSGDGSKSDRASIGFAQAVEPAAPAATTPPADSKGPQDQSPPAASSPPNPTSTTEIVKPAKTVPGCALKYMAAEVAGKLKGLKWKEFRQQECGPSATQAVFPSTIAPKYAGEPLDKARTHTCADQFTANKATNANGGLKWIEMSGGYYSECVSRLKG